MHYRLWAIIGSSVLGSLFLFNAPVQAHDMRPSQVAVVAQHTIVAKTTVTRQSTTQQRQSAATVIVKRGDTLGKIAATHGTTWSNLARINHIANPNLIFPGQVIVLSGGIVASTPAHATAPVANHAVAPTYRRPTQSAGHATAPKYTPPVRHAVAQAPQQQAPSYSGGSVQAEISATFGPYAGQALRVAACESGYNPGAVNRSSGSSGVFQFMSSTWAGTPYRGQSVFNSSANIHAAYWLFQRDGYTWREWSCRP